MGFKKPIEIADVKMQLLKAHGEICSPYNDGYNAFEIKKELYQVKWIIDELIKRQPTFTGEEEWLGQEYKKQMWSELKR